MSISELVVDPILRYSAKLYSSHRWERRRKEVTLKRHLSRVDTALRVNARTMAYDDQKKTKVLVITWIHLQDV